MPLLCPVKAPRAIKLQPVQICHGGFTHAVKKNQNLYYKKNEDGKKSIVFSKRKQGNTVQLCP